MNNKPKSAIIAPSREFLSMPEEAQNEILSELDEWFEKKLSEPVRCYYCEIHVFPNCHSVTDWKFGKPICESCRVKSIESNVHAIPSSSELINALQLKRILSSDLMERRIREMGGQP